MIAKAYGLKSKTAAVPFSSMVDTYLKWAKENKASWDTDLHRAKPLQKAFSGKLMSDINPFVIEKYKMARLRNVSRSTVNKELILGNQVFKKDIEWKKYSGENPFAKTTKFKIRKEKKTRCSSHNF